MSKVITVCNAKGGTGKTTTAINLAAVLGIHFGYNILAIDMDSQGNLGIGFGLDPRTTKLTSYHLLADPQANISNYIQQVRPNIDLIPNAINSRLKKEIEVAHNRDSLLNRKLRPVRHKYDYIIIDTPPAIETPTMNAIIASDEIIVVVDCGYFAMYGLTDLMTELAEARDAHDKSDLIIHGLLNLYSKNQVIDNQIKSEVSNFFGDLMLQSIIHKNVRLAEASANNQPVIEYDRTASGYFDFVKMSKELIGEQEAKTKSGRKAKSNN